MRRLRWKMVSQNHLLVLSRVCMLQALAIITANSSRYDSTCVNFLCGAILLMYGVLVSCYIAGHTHSWHCVDTRDHFAPLPGCVPALNCHLPTAVIPCCTLTALAVPLHCRSGREHLSGDRPQSRSHDGDAVDRWHQTGHMLRRGSYSDPSFYLCVPFLLFSCIQFGSRTNFSSSRLKSRE